MGIVHESKDTSCSDANYQFVGLYLAQWLPTQQPWKMKGSVPCPPSDNKGAHVFYACFQNWINCWNLPNIQPRCRILKKSALKNKNTIKLYMACVWGNLAVHAAAFQAWTADSFTLTGPFFEWPGMLHSFQHLLMLETECPSATSHFEILMDKVKLPEPSVKFRENLTVLVIGPYTSGDV